MNGSQLLTELRSLGASVWVDGDELKLKAPKGVLTAELREELKRNKASLIATLAPTEGGAEVPLASREKPLPLSSTQERLWFLDQLEPGLTAYNLWLGMRLDGALDRGALERSITEIVRRHEVLRARFAAGASGPTQEFAEPPTITLDPLESQHADAEARRKEITRELVELCRAPYDLATGPLYRAHLGRVDEQAHILVLGMHHSVSDGWSLGVLTDELRELYSAFTEGRKPELPELPRQYADYCVWQRDFLEGSGYAAQLEFWKSTLGGELPVLQLPTDRPRPPVQSFAGDNARVELTHEELRALTELAKSEGATLFMALLALYQTLLFRLTGQPDVLVGTPIAARNRPEFHNLVGYFANTLVVRTDVGGDPSFRELLRRVRSNCLDAYENQDAPFERLVNALQPERDLATTPVVQTLFSLEESPATHTTVGDLEAEFLDLTAEVSRMDVTFGVFRSAETVMLWAEYCTDLFERETVERWLRGFKALMLGVLRDPDAAITGLPIIGENERRLVLEEWNATYAEVREDVCADQLFEEQAARTPDAIALVAGVHEVTYAELDKRANALAQHLRELGVVPGETVAIATGRTIEMFVGILATLKAGGAYVPLDLDYPAERLGYIFEDVGARAILTRAEVRGVLPRETGDAHVLELDARSASREDPGPVERRSTSKDTAYVIYTSGSTGQPKGVALEHTGLVNLLTWHQRAYDVRPADRATHLAGTAFDASVWEMWPYLTAGSTLVLVPDDVRLSPPELLAWMAANRITQTFLPTPLAEACLREELPEDLALEWMLTGGDKLHRAPDVELPFRLVNHYGPTENTVVATATEVRATGDRAAAPPIGRPIDNVRVYLLDGAGQPVPIGVSGELFIAGQSLAQGYFGRPDMTAERFRENPAVPGERVYATGDAARWTKDGQLEFVGRLDNQVKVRGFRVELGEIESVLSKLAGVDDCVVIVREDAPGDARLVAYFVASGDVEVSDLRDQLAQKLPEYMVPAHFVTLDAFPLTPNGKVETKRLPAPDVGGDASSEYAAPGNETERRLCEIWQDVLGVDRVGIHDNFFQLGGNSLLSTQAMGRAREAFDVDAPLRLLFEQPTIAGLAKRLDGDADEVAGRAYEAVFDRCLIPLQPKGWKRALFVVSGAHAHEDDFLRFVGALLPHMKSDQPVYGFKARGLDGVSPPHGSAQEMAEQYVREMRELQPEGPYLIAGNCVGGIVAFEMGQQLRAQGQEVGLLALLDTIAPIASYREFVDDHYRFWKLDRFLGHWGKLGDLSMSEKLTYVFERFGRKARRLMPMSDEARRTKHIENVERRYSSVLAHYEPQPYDGRVTLVVNEEVQRELPGAGWDEWVRGELDVRVVPGDHVTRLTQNAGPSAQVLEECLEQATRGARMRSAAG